jgi:predicted outer membrane protein
MFKQTSARLGACVVTSLLFASACGDDDGDLEQVADIAVEEGVLRGEALADMTDEELAGQSETVALEVAEEILLTIDTGEILQAEIAVDRADQDDVEDYAQAMIEEHSLHAELVSQVFGALLIQPRRNQIAETLRAEALAGAEELSATDAPDFVYMRMQITMHQEASIVVGSLIDFVDTPEVDRLLIETQDIIEAHRLEAIDILRNL